MDRDTLYDVVLATKALGHLRVQESDKGKGPERLGDEDVGDLAKFGEILA